MKTSRQVVLELLIKMEQNGAYSKIGRASCRERVYVLV